MHFPHRPEIEFIEETADIQALIDGVASQVVSVENQSASGAGGDGVKERRGCELRGGIRQQVNDVFEQEGNPVALLNQSYPLAYQIERRFGARHGEHRAYAL